MGGAGQPAGCRLAPRQHRADAHRPDGVDVPLSRHLAGRARREFALVGVATRPEAGLVLPGELRRWDRRGDLRRGEPRPLVARDPRDGVERLDRVAASPPRGGAGEKSRRTHAGTPWVHVAAGVREGGRVDARAARAGEDWWSGPGRPGSGSWRSIR